MESLCAVCGKNYVKVNNEVKCPGCGYLLLPAKEQDFIIDIYDVKKKLDEEKDFIFLDVREPFELKLSNIENTINIPLKQIPGNLDKLDKNKEIIVFCRTGKRSHDASRFLIQKGYDAKNMDGGINMWASLIDSSLTPY